jgi:hypothetical protein
MVMAAKLTRLTYKIVIQLLLVQFPHQAAIPETFGYTLVVPSSRTRGAILSLHL